MNARGQVKWQNRGPTWRRRRTTAQSRIELERYKELGYMKVIPVEEAEAKMAHGTASRLGLIVKNKPNGEVKRRVSISSAPTGTARCFYPRSWSCHDPGTPST